MTTERQRLWMLAAILTFCGIGLFSSCSDSTDDSATPEGGYELDGADKTAYTERQIPVNRGGQDAGTVTLRYYEDMPDVPYISVADYHHLMLPGTSFSVAMTGSGQYLLTNKNGTAIVNTRAETLVSDDHESFANMMDLTQSGMPNVVLDESPFVRYAGVDWTPATKTLTYDYSPYGIDLRGDGRVVYFPLATINDYYDDVSMRHVAFNGEKIVTVVDAYHSDLATLEPAYWAPLTRDTRPEGMADFNYRNLCFSLDHYYGFPGRAFIEGDLQEVGLDKALQNMGEAGAQLRRLLLSTSTYDYVIGMELLGKLFFDGGHTILSLMNPFAGDKDFVNRCKEVYNEEIIKFSNSFGDYARICELEKRSLINYLARHQQRDAIYGKGVYYVKHGNTVVCVFDTFMTYVLDQWRAFYAGTGPKPTIETCPEDAFVIFLDALNRAEAAPEVENFILDISSNGGGSTDLVVAITSLMTDNSYFNFENTLMGRRTKVKYDIDRNFDGKFDVADRDVKYHLNFAVLESCVSFSCGNLLPSLLKDQGVLVIGETSGGGACCVGEMATADGYAFRMSTYHARLLNDSWQNIDNGVIPHVAITPGPQVSLVINGANVSVSDYSDFYNIEKLSQIVNDWYGGRTH